MLQVITRQVVLQVLENNRLTIGVNPGVWGVTTKHYILGVGYPRNIIIWYNVKKYDRDTLSKVVTMQLCRNIHTDIFTENVFFLGKLLKMVIQKILKPDLRPPVVKPD